MSTYWGYHCAGCNESSPTWWNHGDEQLTQILTHWPALQTVWKLCNSVLWQVEITVHCDTSPTAFEFLDTHYEHGVIIVNEYGQTP